MLWTEATQEKYVKKFLIAAVLCLSSISSFGAAKPEVQKTFDANVQIHQETVSGNSTCSATAIGPQALLTASHCELPTDVLEVSSIDNPVKIVGRFRDDLDHTIYLIDGTFKTYVPLALNTEERTDRVFIWGNPGELADMYREGVVSGIRRETTILSEGPLEIYFDLNAFNGDSGAGIFNADGKVVGVVSFSLVQGKGDNLFRMTGAYPVMFSKEDLAKAVAFTTPKKDSKENVNNTNPSAPSSGPAVR